jgi:hypothetical protein
VSRDVHVDLAASTPELTVRAAMVHGSPHVVKTVKHMQPVTTEPPVSSKSHVGVVVHLSKTRKKQINISSIEQRQQTRAQNKPPQQHVNSDSDLDRR